MKKNKKIFICKNCGKENDGSFGKGIFCSRHCLCVYAGKQTKHHSNLYKRLGIPYKKYICDYCGENIEGFINLKKHLLICPKKRHLHFGYNNWECKICGKIFETRRKMYEHKKTHNNLNKKKYIINYINEKCQFCGNVFYTKGSLKTHEKYCEQNPNRKISNGFHHSEEFKKRLSNKAKKQNLGGWRSSKIFYYNGIKLSSSYEVEVAKNLDKNNIK